MSKTALKEVTSKADHITPHWHQNAKEIQKFGTVISDMPIGLDESARLEITERLNVHI